MTSYTIYAKATRDVPPDFWEGIGVDWEVDVAMYFYIPEACLVRESKRQSAMKLSFILPPDR